MDKQIAWSSEKDLALLREVLRVEPYDGEYGTLTVRWKTIASKLSFCFECTIPHRSARDHFEVMLEGFKATDKAQRMFGTCSEEEVTEQVQILQDIEQKRRDSLESTGSQLCVEAEQQVAKRQRSVGPTPKKEDQDIQDLLEFEKQKHTGDHTYRMERLEYEKEEQKLRLAQMAESAKRNEQLERLLL
ncbi:hypothetical protein DYB26_001194, partial [Aphanomyces astaci]